MEPERIQDSHEVARLFAHFFSNVLGILLALLGILYGGSRDIYSFALAAWIALVAGVPLLLLLLGTSIYVYRKGEGACLPRAWSSALMGAAVLPVYLLGQEIWSA